MKTIYVILALVISFFWGIQPIVHKYVLDIGISGASIMMYSAIAYTFCLILFLIFERKTIEKDFHLLNFKNIFLMLVTSIVTVFLSNVIYYYVLKENASSLVSALISSCPIFTMMIAYFIFSEKIDYFGISGILFIVTGVILISYNNHFYLYESLELMD